jgi:carbonic anhydrase/acetyltransferase-like protein (isoleucine patch superfamily)
VPCRQPCIIAPNASITCALIGDEVLIGAGAVVLEAAYVAHGSEIREHATVHVRTRLEPGSLVPIGWIAVGDPAEILPPHQREHIWELQRTPHFPECARYQRAGMSEPTGAVARLLAQSLEAHIRDTPYD